MCPPSYKLDRLADRARRAGALGTASIIEILCHAVQMNRLQVRPLARTQSNAFATHACPQTCVCGKPKRQFRLREICRSDGHADGIGHVEVIWTANLGRAFDFVREQDAAAASTGSVNSGSFVGPGLK